MILGAVSAWSTTTDMVFTSSNNENHKHHNADVSKPPKSQTGNNPLHTITGPATNGRVDNSKHRGDPCPCCNQQRHECLKQKIDPELPLPFDEHNNSYRSLFEVASEDSDDSPFDDLDEGDRMLPGVLGEGIAYTVKETIVQGYIEKKGSGFDWLGSRAWKRRWAVLVKARTDGHDVDVPLLQIFWDYHSPTPSTVISLDSAVLLPENNVNATKPEKNNINSHPYRFQIRHLKKSVNPEISSVQLTRILSCSEESERDQWVYSINEALLNYEKEKASAARRTALGGLCSMPMSMSMSLSMSPPRGPIRSWANEDVMPQQSNSRIRQRTSASCSPPRIPLCSRKNIPR